ncbi:MAG: hypothetical protein KIPDCIKN_02282 [Haliscomenobacter sp.]|jgi:hypothetical protein|nr:hypothetical protein [Haliscomenobacter sp.]
MNVLRTVLEWSLIRKIQGFFGLILLIGFAGQPDDYVSLGFGLFFLAQAVLNIGCAGQACAAPGQNASRNNLAEADQDLMVTYEEVERR